MLFFERKREKKPFADDDAEKLKEFLNEPGYEPVTEEPYPDIDTLVPEKGHDIEFPLKKSPKMSLKPVEMPKKDENYKFPDEVEIVEKSIEPVAPERVLRRDGSAPLFIKVDKYNEILDTLQQSRALLSGIKPVFSLLIEVEGVRKEALDALRMTLQKIEKNVIMLDSEMTRPGEPVVGATPASGQDAKHVESSLNQLQSQLGSLKAELEKMKS